MDELRWILLGLSLVLIVGVYFWGRKRNRSSAMLDDSIKEMPSIYARDDNGWVDGVSPVRVVGQNDLIETPSVKIDKPSDNSSFNIEQVETGLQSNVNQVSNNSHVNRVNQSDNTEPQGNAGSVAPVSEPGVSFEKNSQTVQPVNYARDDNDWVDGVSPVRVVRQNDLVETPSNKADVSSDDSSFNTGRAETDSLADINEVSDDSNINEVNQYDKPEPQGDTNSAMPGHDSDAWFKKSSQTIQPVNYAQDDNGWVDGVSPVRVVSQNDPVETPSNKADVSSDDSSFNTGRAETDSLADINEVSDDSNINEVNQPDKPESQGDMNSATSGHDSGTSSEKSSQTVQSVNDVISVFLVVAKDRVIKGEHIYSACLGNNLQYGDMKIFHRLASDGEIMFSLSDMRKPGWFDIDQINSHITRGVSLFTQLSMVSDPVKTVDDMLLCAHKMAGLLGAQLCGQDRMLLNESSVKLMREKAKGFADGRLSANI